MSKTLFILSYLLISISTCGQSDIKSVFDLILNKYIVSPNTNKKFFVVNYTCSEIGLNSDLFLKTIRDSIADFEAWAGLIYRFDNTNKRSHRLPRINGNFTYIRKKVVDKELYRTYYRNGIHLRDPKRSWASFCQMYPDCDGIIKLSKPVFSSDKSKFIIIVEFINGTDLGFGNLILGEKILDDWLLSNDINLFRPLSEIVIIGD